jgi:hypothetical protein
MVPKGDDMKHDKIEEREIEGYNPNHLLDSLIERLQLRNDAALSRLLGVESPVISKIRHMKVPVGASLLIRMHEATDIGIQDLRALMGDQRKSFRVGYTKPKHRKQRREESVLD